MSEKKTKKAIKLIVGLDNITQRIGIFAKQEKLRDEELHLLACSAVASALESDNSMAKGVALCAKLLESMGSAAYKSGYVKWVCDYLPVTFDPKKKLFNIISKKKKAYTDWKKKGYTPKTMETAEEYWVHSPDLYKDVDPVATIKGLLKRIAKREEEIAEGKVGKETLKGSAKLITALRALPI